jgi:hypothetical protein
MDAQRNLRILAPTDFQSEVLPPMVVASENQADVARSFAKHIEKSLNGIATSPKFTLVNVQILRAKTFSDQAVKYEAGREYLTVGIEGNSSLVRAIGVIRFSIAGNILTGTLQTREAFAAGRSMGSGLANWLFPEPDRDNLDENGRPRQGCGSVLGMILAGGAGYGLVAPWAGQGMGLVAGFIAIVLASVAVGAARQGKERHQEELLTIIRLQLVTAYGEFNYSPSQKSIPMNPKVSRHEKYGDLTSHQGESEPDHSWVRD